MDFLFLPQKFCFFVLKEKRKKLTGIDLWVFVCFFFYFVFLVNHFNFFLEMKLSELL